MTKWLSNNNSESIKALPWKVRSNEITYKFIIPYYQGYTGHGIRQETSPKGILLSKVKLSGISTSKFKTTKEFDC